MTDRIRLAKQAVRERVWAIMEREGVVVPPGGAHGRIPNFVGAEAAADRLAELQPWRSATVVMANPDWAQLPVRIRALLDGKLVYMAVPRLAALKPFYLLDPAKISASREVVADPRGAAAHVPTVSVDEMYPVDLIICGSVAVNRSGVRIGKGSGYSDVEVALLTQAGLVGPQTTIVSTVHRVQILGDDLAETDHDLRVDLIATPDEVIQHRRHKPLMGIVRESLTAEMVNQIPVLRRLAEEAPREQ